MLHDRGGAGRVFSRTPVQTLNPRLTDPAVPQQRVCARACTPM